MKRYKTVSDEIIRNFGYTESDCADRRDLQTGRFKSEDSLGFGAYELPASWANFFGLPISLR
jgi:hypothetical protein